MMKVSWLLLGVIVTGLLSATGVILIVVVAFNQSHNLSEFSTAFSLITPFFCSAFSWLLNAYLNRKRIHGIKEFRELIRGLENEESPLSPITPVFDWLYMQPNILRRTNQTFKLALTEESYDEETYIKICGMHKFTIFNPSKKARKVKFNLISELGRQSILGGGFTECYYTMEEKGEFKRMPIPTHKLSDKSFCPFKEDLTPSQKMSFEFHSYGIFRLHDRFTWYSQDFCERCDITIEKNYASSNSKINYHFNHHNASELDVHGKKSGDRQDTLNIDEPIYPYEGFTMLWNFETQKLRFVK